MNGKPYISDWQNSTQTQLRFRLGAGANFLIEGLWNYEYNVMMRWMIMMNHVSALPWGHPYNASVDAHRRQYCEPNM